MRNFIAKVLGLPTTDQVQEFKNLALLVSTRSDDAVESSRRTLEGMVDLKSDMKTLYTELDQNIANVKMNVKAIKPVLKVQDEEAVKFIKDILKRHDSNMNNNQEAVTKQMYEVKQLKSKAESILKHIESKDMIIEELSMKIKELQEKNKKKSEDAE